MLEPEFWGRKMDAWVLVSRGDYHTENQQQGGEKSSIGLDQELGPLDFKQWTGVRSGSDSYSKVQLTKLIQLTFDCHSLLLRINTGEHTQ